MADEQLLQNDIITSLDYALTFFPDGSWTNYLTEETPLWRNVVGVDVTLSQLDPAVTNWIAGKFTQPTGTTNQYLNGAGTPVSLPLTINGTNGTLTLGTVSTVSYPGPATATLSGTANAAVLNLGLVQGAPGTMGSTGATGAAGLNGTNATPVQRIRAQTDSSGNYSWTYPLAYPSGTIPVITAICEGGTNQPVNIQIVGAPTYTNCLFKVLSLPSTTLLSVIVLGSPAGAQTYIDAIASAP